MIKKGSFVNKSAAVWFPILLFSLTYLVLGFHYETNDDLTISWLLRGIAIQPPLTDLSLYFHGLSHLLVQLYKLVPQWPWYGLVLYALLYVATVAAFLFLQRSASHNNRNILGWFLLFFLAGWYEHVFWFNYMRVPLLLAGTGYLLLLQLPGKKSNGLLLVVTGLLFLLALCFRPSAALLGVAVAGPATFLLTAGSVYSWQKLRPIILYAGLGACFFIFLHLAQTPAQKQYQRLDWLKSTVLDFQIYRPQPQTQTDALAFRALNQWLLADTQVINEAFYARAGSINLAYILKEVAPLKVSPLVIGLVKDHFLILAVNAFLLLFLFRNQSPDSVQNRKLLFGYQVYFWLLILVVGIFLKLPPRVITPCLSLYTLVNSSIYFRHGINDQVKLKPGKIIGLVFIMLVMLQLYKIKQRARWQQKNQLANEAFISAAGNSFEGKIIVTNTLPDYFRSLSPFRNYDFNSNYVFLLTGWSTLEPANRLYYKKLTGQTDFGKTVESLSRNNNAVWLLSPGFYEFIRQYFFTFHRQEINLQIAPDWVNGQYPGQTYKSIGSPPL